ncbi:1-deoxy-D-xylulose-5-phosphate synthase N-terminal domain-containing protein [Selenomonas sp. KH1T6]|uniref:1-deoxy-D-xylulose-5-phosphate synthase N-terminal domain-containing protein n=1 Tax=Selenomonas sp. KH1T6 TaxID=3158784 RepID=UPI0008A7FD9D|nr:1-deoxy-D-xylulose-5-phosphate synthase [Selenomonas ruminantium]
MYLEKISGPQDIKAFNEEQRKVLAQEMREAMLKRASVHGGHFGPDFGIVECIIALHTVFDSPKDKFVFDISHQAYPHKMLTGRKDAYLYAEHYDDVSGYTNPEESEHDMFNVGHTSTSISLATGLAKARDLKGDKLAEENKEDWHWHMPFDIETGEARQEMVDPYAEQTAATFLRLAREDEKFIAISAATPSSMGLTQERRRALGKHYLDVGIAEEQAVAMASGLARNGAHPVFGDFSSFFQRTYDQLSQDVCVNNNPATFLVFWASMYGMNDVTHLGFYDIPMMSNIPNLVYLAPTSPEEYQAMLDWAIPQEKYPVAIRVPHAMVGSSKRPVRESYDELNKYEVVKDGSHVALIGLGNFYNLAEETAAKLKEQGIEATLINPLFITGQDKELLEKLKANHELVVTLEDGVLDGGFGEKIARFYSADKMKVLNFGLSKKFYDRYDYEALAKENHLTAAQIAEDILANL